VYFGLIVFNVCILTIYLLMFFKNYSFTCVIVVNKEDQSKVQIHVYNLYECVCISIENHRCRDHKVVEFTTTFAVSAYQL